MDNDWQIWLNVNSIQYNKIIGKNAYYIGNKNNIYIDDNITIIGYGKIYNENELWKLLEIEPPSTTHCLQIVADLYLYFKKMNPNKYDFENILELLDGDFSFILLDFNLLGEESWLYVARDPIGLYPLYFYEHPKKVQFEMEMKQYCFSSVPYIENKELTPFISGNYQTFSHSFKVSANWKQIKESKSFYKLPFHSTFLEKDIQYEDVIDKRLKYLRYRCNQEKIKIGLISINIEKKEDIFDFITFSPRDFGFTINEKSFLQIQYIENEFPSIISRLKFLLNSNDPAVIRAYFIPCIIAKYLYENMPEIKHVFLGEDFTKDWIEKSYLERNKSIYQMYLDININGWTSIFISYGIELYMPYLDKTLFQMIVPPRLI